MKGMKQLGKQMVVYLMAFLMLFTIAPVSALADEVQLLDSEQELVLGRELSVSAEEGESVWLSFKPQEGGEYNLRSYDNGGSDLYAVLYDAGRNELEFSDDDSDSNFSLTYLLQGGATYYYKVQGCSESAFSYKVFLEKLDTEVCTVTFYANHDMATGWFDEDFQSLHEKTKVYYPDDSIGSDEETLSATDPLSGLVHVGWSEDENATEPDESLYAYDGMKLYAVWKQYISVVLDANGGYFGDDPEDTQRIQNLDVDGCFTFFETPQPPSEEYTFMGWASTKAKADAFEVDVFEDETPASELETVYAVWSREVEVTYVAENGYIEEYDTTYAAISNAGDCFYMPNVRHKSPFMQFDGWFDEDGNEYTEYTIITGPVTVYARWKGLLAGTLELDEDLTVSSEGETLWYSFTPTEDGFYKFYSKDPQDCDPFCQLYDENGNTLTYDDDNGGNRNFLINQILTAGKTYYYGLSECDSMPFDYTVHLEMMETVSVTFHTENTDGKIYFDEDPEQTQKTVLVGKGENALDQAPAYSKPADSFYYVAGWAADENGEPLEEAIADEDMDLYVVLGVMHPVTLDANGGYFNDDEDQKTLVAWFSPGESFGYDAVTGPDGKVLAGWAFTKAKADALEADIENWMSPADGLETVYAVWGEYVDVTFNANGGYINGDEGQTTITMEYITGQPFHSPNVYHSNILMQFDGWYDEPEGGNQIDGTAFIKEEMTLYAHWTGMETEVLELDRDIPVSSDAEKVYFSFTPEEDGVYKIYSKDRQNNCDPYCELYDEDMEYITSDDDGNGDRDFQIKTELEAGKTYYYAFRECDIDEPFAYTVRLTKIETVNITFHLDEANGDVYFDDDPNVLQKTIPWEKGETFYSQDVPQLYYKEDALLYVSGWALSADAYESQDEFETLDDLDLYAIFSDVHVFELDANGGYFDGDEELTTITQKAAAGTWFHSEHSVEYPGKTLLGWAGSKAKADALEVEIVEGETLVDYLTTIYAVWGEPVEMTYHANGGYFAGTEDTELHVDALKGDHFIVWEIYHEDMFMQFDGWYDEPEGGTKYDEKTIIRGNTAVYAHWRQITPTPIAEEELKGAAVNQNEHVFYEFTPDETAFYTIDSTDPKGGRSAAVLYDSDLNEIARDNNTSYGSDPDGFHLKVHLEEGKTYYLQIKGARGWEANCIFLIRKAAVATITLNANHEDAYFETDSGHADSIETEEAIGFMFSRNPAIRTDNENIEFLGWSKNPDAKAADDEIPIWHDTNLYAVWGTKVNVTLHANHPDAGFYNDDTDEYDLAEYETIFATGMDVARIDRPVINDSDLNFICWSTNPDEVEMVTVITEDMTDLYAIWGMPYSPDFENAQELILDEEKTADFYEGSTFRFVPETDGIYTFASEGEYDMFGELYDAEHNYITYDDDRGNGRNFQILYSLQAGETYYLFVRNYNENEYFNCRVSVTEKQIVQVQFDANRPENDAWFDDMNPGELYTEEFAGGMTYGSDYLSNAVEPNTNNDSIWFVGWSVNPDAKGPDESVTLNTDTTLYAVWSPAVVVTIHANRETQGDAWYNSGEQTVSFKYPVGFKIERDYHQPSSNNPKLHFEGWSTDPNATAPDGLSITVTADLSDIYAVWTEKVEITFDTGFEDTTNTYFEEYDRDQEIFIYTSTTKGYYLEGEELTDYPEVENNNPDIKFAGWSKTKNASEPDEDIVASDGLTLYAVWTDVVVVTYDANGGRFGDNSAIYARAVGKGLPFENDWNLRNIRKGHPNILAVFDGWYDAKEGGKQYTEDDLITQDITLYAQWKIRSVTPLTLDQSEDVSYDDDQRALFCFTPDEDGVYSFVMDLTQQGYIGENIVFDEERVELYMNRMMTDPQTYLFYDNFRAGVTYYLDVSADSMVSRVTAKKETPAIVTCEVNKPDAYFIENGERVHERTFNTIVGSSVTIPFSAPTFDTEQRTVFLGWSTDPNATEPMQNIQITSENFKVYGVWADCVIITYDANGGTLPVKGIASVPPERRELRFAVGSGFMVEPSEYPYRFSYFAYHPDYEFDGWYDEDEDGNLIEEGTVLTEDMTVYAHWKSFTSVTGVRISPVSGTMFEGRTMQMQATVLPEDASNKEVFWTSTDPNVAEVDENGLVTATGAGNAVIMVETVDGGFTASCTVTIRHDLIKTAAKAATCTEAGNSEYWTCNCCGKYFADARGEREIAKDFWILPATGHSWSSPVWTWTGSDAAGYTAAKAVFTCSNNSAHKETVNATVTETISGGYKVYTATAQFDGALFKDEKKVAVSVAPTKIKLTPNPGEVAVKSTLQLKATFTPSNTTLKDLTWTSSDTSIATVNANGKVTGKKYGEVTITAVSKANSKKASCKVKVLLSDATHDNVDDEKFDAIYWVVDNDISKMPEKFGTNDSMTRGQFVRFLFRAAGMEGTYKPTAKKSPFKDVAKSYTHYKAILWAVDQGLISGYSDGTFRPEAKLTRSNVATILWKFAGSPKVSNAKNPFTDVSKSAALAWGKSKGVFTALSGGKFNPKGNCLRGDFAVFLFRYNNKVKKLK